MRSTKARDTWATARPRRSRRAPRPPVPLRPSSLRIPKVSARRSWIAGRSPRTRPMRAVRARTTRRLRPPRPAPTPGGKLIHPKIREGPQGEGAEAETEDSAGTGEKQTFEDQLPAYLAQAGSQGGAHAELPEPGSPRTRTRLARLTQPMRSTKKTPPQRRKSTSRTSSTASSWSKTTLEWKPAFSRVSRKCGNRSMFMALTASS